MAWWPISTAAWSRPTRSATTRSSSARCSTCTSSRTPSRWSSTGAATASCTPPRARRAHMIVVGGEALVDLVAGEGGDLAAHLGGGPFNCARTLGRLERPVAYLGRISRDRFGTRLREQLRADGVNLCAVVDTEDPTTLALVELDAGGAASYRFYLEGTSVPGLTPDAALAVLPERVEGVHVGSLGLVVEPTAAALEAVVAQVAGEALV